MKEFLALLLVSTMFSALASAEAEIPKPILDETNKELKTPKSTKYVQPKLELKQKPLPLNNVANLLAPTPEIDVNQTKEFLELKLSFKAQKDIIKNLKASQNKLKKELNNIKSSDEKMSHSEWASILLACVAILVTVLGVVIALISIMGYNNIKETTKTSAEKMSTDIATRVAKEEANKQINEVAKQEIARLIDEGELTEQLESAVDIIVRKNKTTDELGGFNKYPEIDDETNS